MDANIDNPIVLYNIVTPNQRLLPAPSSLRMNFTSKEDTPTVPERLCEQIEWESHVNEADKLDYIVAVSSGVIAGVIDVVFTDKFSLERASEWGTKQVNKFVLKIAQADGYKGDNLKEAIAYLENNHPMAADGNINEFGGGRQHHFRDFSHHFSIGGCAASIFTQFTELSIGTDTKGNLLVVPIPESHKKYIGKNIQEKIVFGVIEWFFHMVSDMAGSSGTFGEGTGIPGPIVSLIKELSALPIFKDSANDEGNFRQFISKLFNGTYLAKRDALGKIIKGTEAPFDLRMEIGILGEIARQAIPVIINQCVVRGFYFCRRLTMEIKDLNIQSIRDLSRIAPEDILPWNTPAVLRMITVSSAVFTGIDIVAAGVMAASREEKAKEFFLRINYVGIAVFVIACSNDFIATQNARKLERGEHAEDRYEYDVSKLSCLKLDYAKAQILYSLIRQIVLYDIEKEKHDKRAAKKLKWLNEWTNKFTETMQFSYQVDTDYLMDEATLYDSLKSSIDNSNDSSWAFLIALEAMMFKPYFALYDKNDKDYKGLTVQSDYLTEVFCKRQNVVTSDDLEQLKAYIDYTQKVLDRTFSKQIAIAAGALAIVALSGGIAFYAAPAIAPIIAGVLGAEISALAGAALTSASLAFLGGGALAVGGAGMAGGVMVIAGGGVLLGAVGGVGAATAVTMAFATNGGYVLNECTKLITFSEEVLLKRYNDTSAVSDIIDSLNYQIVRLESDIESLDNDLTNEKKQDSETKKDEISPRQMLKIQKKCHKYLVRTRDELLKALEKRKSEQDKKSKDNL